MTSKSGTKAAPAAKAPPKPAIVYPTLCIEIHRYSDPDGFRFFTMVETRANASSLDYYPFAEHPGKLGPSYVENDRRQVNIEQARLIRSALRKNGYKPVSFMDSPNGLCRMIVGNYVPIEWKPDGQGISPDCVDRITVWCLGEMPVLM